MNSNIYIPQQAHLKKAIRSIWQVEGRTSFQYEKIIPKGVTEIIFNFSEADPIHGSLANKQFHISRCIINGFNTAPIQMALPRHRSFFGVELQPVVIKKLLGIPAHELADLTLDLTLLDPFFDQLWHRLAAINSFDERVLAICNWIEKKTFSNEQRDQLLNDFLYSPDTLDISVPQLANHLCWSPRHLSRKMHEITGMNTEEMILYKKYLHAVELMHRTDHSLTQIAYQCNFTDQAHFIRSFRSFTDMTPGSYRKTKSQLQGHIFE